MIAGGVLLQGGPPGGAGDRRGDPRRRRGAPGDLLDPEAGRPSSRSRSPARCARRCGPSSRRPRARDRAPTAVSPDSITALEPSRTALATSVTSALVGTGEVTIDSSIWVAVITGRPKRTPERMIRFWWWGTSSRGTRTPRSPRATITASATSRIAVEVGDRLWRSRSWRRASARRAGRPADRQHVGGRADERHRPTSPLPYDKTDEEIRRKVNADVTAHFKRTEPEKSAIDPATVAKFLRDFGKTCGPTAKI